MLTCSHSCARPLMNSLLSRANKSITQPSSLVNKQHFLCRCVTYFLQIEREVDEEAEGLSSSFKENKSPISPAGDEEKMENSEEKGSIAADTMMYSQRLQQKKEALLKRIAKLQKQCEE